MRAFHGDIWWIDISFHVGNLPGFEHRSKFRELYKWVIKKLLMSRIRDNNYGNNVYMGVHWWWRRSSGILRHLNEKNARFLDWEKMILERFLIIYLLTIGKNEGGDFIRLVRGWLSHGKQLLITSRICPIKLSMTRWRKIDLICLRDETKTHRPN